MDKWIKKIIAFIVIAFVFMTTCDNTFMVYAKDQGEKEKTTTIYLAGDSTVKTYDESTFITGWGQMISRYIDTDNVSIKNCAQGGRSTRSFINEGRLIDNGKFNTSMEPLNMGPISSNIKSGDYLFIQFGHNDDNSKGYSTMYDRMVPLGTPDKNGVYPITAGTKTSTSELPKEYLDALEADTSLTADAKEAAKEKALKAIKKYGDEYYAYNSGGTYKWFLKQYIDFARQQGVTPVLITPISRAYFDENGKIQSKPGHHGGSDEYWDFRYVEAVRQLAKEENVILIDLFKDTVDLDETIGADKIIYLQNLKAKDGTSTITGNWPSDFETCVKDNNYSAVDNTHQNQLGAYLVASTMAEELKKLSTNGIVAGVNGKEESLSKLKNYIYDSPKEYVEIPAELAYKTKDIAKLYSIVKPIELEEKNEATEKLPVETTNELATNKELNIEDTNKEIGTATGENLNKGYESVPETGGRTTTAVIATLGLLVSAVGVVAFRKKGITKK